MQGANQLHPGFGTEPFHLRRLWGLWGYTTNGTPIIGWSSSVTIVGSLKDSDGQILPAKWGFDPTSAGASYGVSLPIRNKVVSGGLESWYSGPQQGIAYDLNIWGDIVGSVGDGAAHATVWPVRGAWKGLVQDMHGSEPDGAGFLESAYFCTPRSAIYAVPPFDPPHIQILPTAPISYFSDTSGASRYEVYAGDGYNEQALGTADTLFNGGNYGPDCVGFQSIGNGPITPVLAEGWPYPRITGLGPTDVRYEIFPTQGKAYDTNFAGQVVGGVDIPDPNYVTYPENPNPVPIIHRGFFWSSLHDRFRVRNFPGQSKIYLPPIAGYNSSEAHGIDDSGPVIGPFGSPGNQIPSYLPMPPQGRYYPVIVSGLRRVVGFSSDPTDPTRPARQATMWVVRQDDNTVVGTYNLNDFSNNTGIFLEEARDVEDNIIIGVGRRPSDPTGTTIGFVAYAGTLSPSSTGPTGGDPGDPGSGGGTPPTPEVPIVSPPDPGPITYPTPSLPTNPTPGNPTEPPTPTTPEEPIVSPLPDPWGPIDPGPMVPMPYFPPSWPTFPLLPPTTPPHPVTPTYPVVPGDTPTSRQYSAKSAKSTASPFIHSTSFVGVPRANKK